MAETANVASSCPEAAEAQNLPQYRLALMMQILSGGGLQLKTAPAEALLTDFLQWITGGMLGGIVCGPSRFGKTSAVRWSCKHLSDMFGFVRFIEVPIRTHGTYSEPAFFDYLLQRCGVLDKVRGSANRRNQLHRYLFAQGERSPLRMIILVFDEAQDMARICLKWIQNIANELASEGSEIKVFVVLVGQPELMELKNEVVTAGLDHFVGRYMAGTHEFKGIRTEQELVEVFAAYDSAVYPRQGKDNPLGKTIKEHFLNPELASRIGLEDLAPPFWTVFTNVWKQEFPSGDVQVPMHYVSSALLVCMQRMSKLGADATEISPQLIEDSINFSGVRVSAEMAARRAIGHSKRAKVAGR